jgi:hypothetical protein
MSDARAQVTQLLAMVGGGPVPAADGAEGLAGDNPAGGRPSGSGPFPNLDPASAREQLLVLVKDQMRTGLDGRRGSRGPDAIDTQRCRATWWGLLLGRRRPDDARALGARVQRAIRGRSSPDRLAGMARSSDCRVRPSPWMTGL